MMWFILQSIILGLVASHAVTQEVDVVESAGLSLTCQYVVEAGMYSGYYKRDTSSTNSNSDYPTLKKLMTSDDGVIKIPLQFSESVGLKWEGDGYYLVGLDEKWSVAIAANICSENIDSTAKDVSFGLDKEGVIYRNDDTQYCNPKQEYRWAEDFLGYTLIPNAPTLLSCRKRAVAANRGIRFKAFLRNDVKCWAFGEGLTIDEFDPIDNMGDDYYSCINQENKDLVPLIEDLESDCTIYIVRSQYYDGTFIADLSYEGNLHLYPQLKRYTVELSNGVAIWLAADGYIEFYDQSRSKKRMFMYVIIMPDPLSGFKPATWVSQVSKHMCESSIGYGTVKSFKVIEDQPKARLSRVDPSSGFCYIVDGVYEVDDYDVDLITTKIVRSIERCQHYFKTVHATTEWRALVHNDGVCKAYDMRLPTESFIKNPDKSGTTCIFVDNFNDRSSPSKRRRQRNR